MRILSEKTGDACRVKGLETGVATKRPFHLCVFSGLCHSSPPVETGPHGVTGSGLWPWTTGGDSHLAGFFHEPQMTVAPHAIGPAMQAHPSACFVPVIVLNMWKQAAFMI